MAYLNFKNGVMLFKAESTEGTDSSPDAANNAMLAENIRLAYNPNEITTNEDTGSLDNAGPIVGGMTVTVDFDVHLKGSGVAETPPEFGPLLKSSGWAEVITSTAVPASAEAAADGGSTSLAILGTSAAATAHAYRGMPIVFSSGVSGTSFIAAYDASKNATLTDTMSGAIDSGSNYQIPKNVLYKPGSTSIPSGTMYLYKDGVVWKLVGMRGNVSWNVGAGGIGRLSFSMRGMFSEHDDASVPSATLDSTRAPVFKNAVFKVERAAASIQSFSLNNNNRLTNPDNPNAYEGFDPAQITGRNMTGSFNPAKTLVATRDIVGDFRNNTKRILHARWGSVEGNRVGIVVPQALYTNPAPGDREGLMTEDVAYAAVGADAGAFLCFY